MKITRYCMIAFVALIACWYLPAIAQAEGDSGIRITYIEGTVRIQKPASEGWLKADTAAVLYDGDKISTGEGSRAILAFLDGQQIRLGPRSTLSFVSAVGPDSLSAAFTFHPGPGDIWVNFGAMPVTRSIACAHHFKEGMALATPLLDSLPAIFRMEIGADSTFELKVYRGLLYLTFEGLDAEIDSLNPTKLPEYNAPKIYGDVDLGEGTVVVQSYQKLILTASGEIVSKGAFAPTDSDEQGEWVDWNRALDEKVR